MQRRPLFAAVPPRKLVDLDHGALVAPLSTLIASLGNLGMVWLRRSVGLRLLRGGLCPAFMADRVVSTSLS